MVGRLSTCRAALVVSGLLAGGAALGAEPQAAPAPRLVAGQTVEREIARGERHTFRVAVGGGEVLIAEIEAHGVSPGLALSDTPEDAPEAGSALEAEAYSGYPPVSLVRLAEQASELAIQVTCPGGRQGRYRLRVAVRAPGPIDLKMLGAQAALVKARRQLTKGRSSLPSAIVGFRAAALAFAEIDDRMAQAQALTELAVAQRRADDVRGAVETSDGLLAAMRGRGLLEGDALYNRATLHLYLGEPQPALGLYQQALKLARAMRSAVLQGIALEGLGQLYADLGDHGRSLAYRREAISALAGEGRLGDEAAALQKMGASQLALGQHREALETYTRAQALFVEMEDRTGEANILHSLGTVYRHLGEPARALEYLQRSLALKTERFGRQAVANTLRGISLAHEALGDLDTALESALHALTLVREAPSGHSVHWRIPAQIARLERERGRLPAARAWIESAVSRVEAGLSSLASEGLRHAYADLTHEVYDLYVDILMRLHEAAPTEGLDLAALETSERGRARSLRELLRDAKVTPPHRVDEALLEEERRLRETLSTLAAGQGDGRRDPAAEGELRRLTTEHDAVRARIRAADPRYAALSQAVAVGARDLLKLVEPGTALLEYDLGRPRSYLWVVTSQGVTSHVLPSEEVISPLARRLHERLTARNRLPSGTSAASRRRLLEKADEEWAEAAMRLSQVLLGPVPRLSDHDRLLVVPDGALHYVPFGALPVPPIGPSGAGSSSVPLIVRHEVVHLPSAAVAVALRQDAAGARGPKTVAVFADPVFQREDPRVAARSTRAGSTAARGVAGGSVFSGAGEDQHLFHEGLTMDGERLPRLAYTRTLSEEVTRDVDVRSRLVALDFQASRPAVARADLDRYRLVLFATHGILNSEYPELSGIALSMVDEAGQPQDGFLRLQDIYHLKLAAELVVLGACETGLGQEVRGEGLVGLSRGFFYAGAKRVLASLWKVDEQATVELIKEVYRGTEKEGLSYAAALRQAQLRLRQRPRFRSPYFWAGFVLQGDR